MKTQKTLTLTLDDGVVVTLPEILGSENNLLKINKFFSELVSKTSRAIGETTTPGEAFEIPIIKALELLRLIAIDDVAPVEKTLYNDIEHFYRCVNNVVRSCSSVSPITPNIFTAVWISNNCVIRARSSTTLKGLFDTTPTEQPFSRLVVLWNTGRGHTGKTFFPEGAPLGQRFLAPHDRVVQKLGEAFPSFLSTLMVKIAHSWKNKLYNFESAILVEAGNSHLLKNVWMHAFDGNGRTNDDVSYISQLETHVNVLKVSIYDPSVGLYRAYSCIVVEVEKDTTPVPVDPATLLPKKARNQWEYDIAIGSVHETSDAARLFTVEKPSTVLETLRVFNEVYTEKDLRNRPIYPSKQPKGASMLLLDSDGKLLCPEIIVVRDTLGKDLKQIRFASELELDALVPDSIAKIAVIRRPCVKSHKREIEFVMNF